MNNTDKVSLHKEIDLIQGCINRMANNSFLLKGWLISIVAVVLALSEKFPNLLLLGIILIIPLLSFWYLDAFFLRAEKMYREMYKWVLENRRLKNKEFEYDLNPKRFENKVDSLLKIMFSKTLRTFYGIPLLFNVVFIIYRSYFELKG
jgi:hypothetical protein